MAETTTVRRSRLTRGDARVESVYMTYRLSSENDFKSTTTLPEILRIVKARDPTRRSDHDKATNAVFPRFIAKAQETAWHSHHIPQIHYAVRFDEAWNPDAWVADQSDDAIDLFDRLSETYHLTHGLKPVEDYLHFLELISQLVQLQQRL